MQAQFGALVSPTQAPQAQSQEELDAYLQIVRTQAADQVKKEVNAFAVAFPKSELLGLAYQNQVHACQQLNDFDGMLTAGKKALQANPDNLNTLLMLAPAMASRAGGRPDRDQLLEHAESYARRALEGIDKTRLPHKVSLEHWTFEKHQMQSQAHEVLGHRNTATGASPGSHFGISNSGHALAGPRRNSISKVRFSSGCHGTE